MTMATMTTLPEIDAALAQVGDVAPCQECGAICPVEDMDNVWIGSGYEIQCTVCSRAVFDEAAPEYWADTREEYES